jgi:hypothetical protein
LRERDRESEGEGALFEKRIVVTGWCIAGIAGAATTPVPLVCGRRVAAKGFSV